MFAADSVAVHRLKFGISLKMRQLLDEKFSFFRDSIVFNSVDEKTKLDRTSLYTPYSVVDGDPM